MRAKLRSWWKKIKQHWVAIVVVAIALVAVIVLIVLAYKFDWTGFNSHIGPKLDQNQQYRPEKTLWDWLQLLIIPLVLAVGALLFNRANSRTEQKIALDNRRETALQAYIDKMSELLLHEKLRNSAEEDEVRKIARVRTLRVLPGLDNERKRNVIQFLHESHLINKDDPIIDLHEADLREACLDDAELKGANLSGAKLMEANLEQAKLMEANLEQAKLMRADLSRAELSEAVLDGANLSKAVLDGANLSKVDMGYANLREADLRNADLRIISLPGADLSGANLSGADLGGDYPLNADLSGADLSGANLLNANLSGANLGRTTGTTNEQLKKAKSLQGATLPDGSIHP
jgi:uncharacterized protein YjbI with pentapeptide repeats